VYYSADFYFRGGYELGILHAEILVQKWGYFLGKHQCFWKSKMFLLKRRIWNLF